MEGSSCQRLAERCFEYIVIALCQWYGVAVVVTVRPRLPLNGVQQPSCVRIASITALSVNHCPVLFTCC
jgi:hypothetical protein